MNWGVVWTAGASVLLGLVTNELFAWTPSLARRILRWASTWQADSSEEVELIYAETCEYLDAMPGRLTRVMWAVGRLRFGIGRFARVRARHWFIVLATVVLAIWFSLIWRRRAVDVVSSTWLFSALQDLARNDS